MEAKERHAIQHTHTEQRETTHNIYIHHKETLGLLTRQLTNTDDGPRKMENINMIWSSENSVGITK